jgi:hemoglobin/transferrin/lactoferrin receptor protein
MPFSFSARAAMPYRERAMSALLLVILWLSGLWALPAPAGAQSLSFDIPAGTLDAALNVFAQQAGILLSADAVLTQGRASEGLHGEYTVREAFARLLRPHGLEAREQSGMFSLRRLAQDDVLVLDAVRVQGGMPALTDADRPYSAPASVTHLSQERIERFRGTSVGDIFQGIPGVLVGENRNSGGLDINIRGMQGQGRVPVLVDGARQETTVWRGYAGAVGRSYIDPDLIGGIDIEKGPTMSASGAGATGGLVSARTISANDLIRDDRNWGLRIRAGAIGNNSGSPVEPETPAGLFTGAFSGAPPVYRTDCATEAICSGQFALPTDWGFAEGMDRPDWYEATSWSGSIAAAARLRMVDLVAAWAERHQGNYYAGEHGPSGWVDISNRRVRPFFTEVYPVIRGASSFQAGERIPGTNFMSRSGLLKAKVYLPAEQELELSYLRYSSKYSELMPSAIIRFTNFRPIVQPRDSDVAVDTYTSRYRWAPADRPLLDLNARLWHTRAVAANNSPSDTEPGIYNNDRETYRRWGLELENTSKLQHGAWGESQLRYGVAAQLEDIGSVQLTSDARDAARSGDRDEYSPFIAWQYKPVPTVVFDLGVRHNRFSSRDDKPITVRDPNSPNCVDADNDGVCDPLPNRNRKHGTTPIVSLSWEPGSAGLQFYARYAEAMRMPSLFESTSGFSFEAAPDVILQPEHARNRELGINYRRDGLIGEHDRLRLKFAWFRNHTTDYLTRTSGNLWEEGSVVGVDLSLTMRNIDSVELRGMEFSGGWDLGLLFAELGATRYDHIEICHTGSFRVIRCNDYGIANSYINNMVPPNWHGNLTLGVRLPHPRMVLGARATFMGQRNNPPPFNDDTARGFLPVVPWHAYRVFDFFASYMASEKVRIDFNLDNFTDRYYLDALSLGLVPAPGRTARLSLTLHY